VRHGDDGMYKLKAARVQHDTASRSGSVPGNSTALRAVLRRHPPADLYFLVLEIIVRVLELWVDVAIRIWAVQLMLYCCVSHNLFLIKSN
jgi:hypothetical protein